MAGWLMAWVITLAGCSADALSEGTPDNGMGEAMSGESYINLHIVNNSQPQTRTTIAATREENAIYDGILCIFEGANESTATLKTAVVIDQLINNPGNSTSINITQRLATGTHPYTAGQHLYVLALLNTTSTGFALDGTTLKFNRKVIPDADSNGSITISDVQALTINSIGSTDKHVGFFMTNSNGLVEATALFDTEEAARDGSAASVTVNVERAAARIRVTNGISTTLKAIKLDGNNDSHPTIHRMSWALASEASGNFSLYQQKSHQSGDVVYIPENTSTATDIIVELQLKDGSFLLDDCYKFYFSDYLYTSAEQFVKFLKEGWNGQRGGYNLSARSAEEIYGHMKLELADNGTITVTFTMDTSGYTSDEFTGLTNLKNFLESNTRGFKQGKMYYTFTLAEVQRNNAYNLTLVEETTSAPPASHASTNVTFKFDAGTAGQTATSINGSWFNSNSISIGSNFTYDGKDKTREQTLLKSASKETSVAASNAIEFMITPQTGLTFTPTRVSFKATRYGTDGGDIMVSWVNSDGSTVPLTTEPFKVLRDNATPTSISEKSFEVTGMANSGTCGLRINLYTLDGEKRVGFSDIAIEGTVNNPAQTISGVGRTLP